MMDAPYFENEDQLEALDGIYGSFDYPETKKEAERDFNAFVNELGWLKESDREDYLRAIETHWRKNDDHDDT